VTSEVDSLEAVAQPTGASQLTSALFQAHYTRLVRLAILLVDDVETAEDVVMDAFAGLQRRRLWLRSIDDGFRYLRSSVLNGARSKLRRRRVAREARLDRQPDATASAEELVLAQARDMDLVDAVRRLPRRQREVVVLRYYLGLSESEIADELRVSRGAVKAHASRALDALGRSVEGRAP
jgi:RNA polymerase sigma-70 factor (sigma-E family)